MKTAKELVYKAYCVHNPIESEQKRKEQFECWWSEWYVSNDHKDSFYHSHNVYVDGKRYIQAE